MECYTFMHILEHLFKQNITDFILYFNMISKLISYQFYPFNYFQQLLCTIPYTYNYFQQHMAQLVPFHWSWLESVKTQPVPHSPQTLMLSKLALMIRLMQQIAEVCCLLKWTIVKKNYTLRLNIYTDIIIKSSCFRI